MFHLVRFRGRKWVAFPREEPHRDTFRSPNQSHSTQAKGSKFGCQVFFESNRSPAVVVSGLTKTQGKPFLFVLGG